MSEQKSTDFVADLNEGGPYAFPFVAPGAALCLGMTLRDYFAAKAMVPMVQNRMTGSVQYGSEQDIAGRAYQIADAMLAARSAP